jgi:group I intron endonuclease
LIASIYLGFGVSGEYLIYMHTAPNGKSYIGQTNNLHRRNISHKNTDGCRAFASAIKKYGWDNFTHTIRAEGLTLDGANQLEQELIASHNTLSPNGYNLKTGGKNGGRPSDEAIKRSADARRGKRLSEKQKQRLSELGKTMPKERIEKMVAASKVAMKNRIGPHFNLGRKHGDDFRKKVSDATKVALASPEVRQKMSERRIGLHHSDETKAKQAEAARIRWNKKRAEGTNKEAPDVTAKRAAALRETWRRKKEAAQGDLPGTT